MIAFVLILVFLSGSFGRQEDVVKELRDELWQRNKGNKMLENWDGDPCLPSPLAGFYCQQFNGNFVITKLDLSSKSLQGPIPNAISNLTELRELYLQNNNFTGLIPRSFAFLIHLKNLSIWCNPYLSDELPTSLSSQMNITQKPKSCGDNQERSQIQSSNQHIYVVGTVAAGSLFCSLALGVFFICFNKRLRSPNKKDHPSTKTIEDPVATESAIHNSTNPIVQQFSLQSIRTATCNYKTLIGEGGFGSVYRGTLPHSQEVAVKVRSASSTQGTREFNNELRLLSTVRHDNLVPLIGYCCEDDQQILVYPFMSNGSLQGRLYGEASKRKALDWPTRLSIALGAAKGLMYLHNFAGRSIIHRDVKSSNILLDHYMTGKVADFGFSKYAPQEGDSGASMEVRGTAGYLDPEYYSTQQLSAKSDVFSFGVVLLEIVTGREPLDIHLPRDEWSLVEWAKPYIKESRIEEIVDPTIKGLYHPETMWRVVETALACTESFSTFRPAMSDVVRELEDALIIENNASEYMRSIESATLGSNRFGSNRFPSVDRKIQIEGSLPQVTK